jgi:hypothetical protein
VLGQLVVPGIQMQRSQAVVAGEEELRFPCLLGKPQRLLIRREGQRVVAVALVNLSEHDQWHRQVVEKPKLTVEVDCLLRRLDTINLASIG